MGWNQQLVFKNDTQEWLLGYVKMIKNMRFFLNEEMGCSEKKLPPQAFSNIWLLTFPAFLKWEECCIFPKVGEQFPRRV